jgi:hypothetical protein
MPALLVTGPFLSDFAVSIIAIIITASIIKKKTILYLKISILLFLSFSIYFLL